MIETTLAGALLSMGAGCWWGAATSAVKRNPPDLQHLQERIMHAKNLSMRMEELFRKEQELVDERASYSTLLSLKNETEWLLDVVENRLMNGESSDLDSVDSSDALAKLKVQTWSMLGLGHPRTQPGTFTGLLRRPNTNTQNNTFKHQNSLTTM